MVVVVRVFENRVLKRIFRPKREEVAGGWRRLHSEELHYLHASPNVVRVMKSRKVKWTGSVARMGQMRNLYKILLGKPEGKGALGKPSCRWVGTIRMDPREISWKGMNWIIVA
jgi:hypothetical protein